MTGVEAAAPPSAHPSSSSGIWASSLWGLSFWILGSDSLWMLSGASGEKPLLVLLSARGRPPRLPASLRTAEMRSRCWASRRRSASTRAKSICSRPARDAASPEAAYFQSALANRPASVSESRPSASPQSTFALNQMSMVESALPAGGVAFLVTIRPHRFCNACQWMQRHLMRLFSVVVLLVTSGAYHILPADVNHPVTKFRQTDVQTVTFMLYSTQERR